jgi:outer membrane protein OmpA-like peptidoglycan-associated protein
MNIGVFGGLNSVKSFAIIPFFPNDFACGNYREGNGNGFLAGINFGIEFYNSNLVADFRLFNETRPATLNEFSDPANCPFILDPISSEYILLNRKHTYSVDFSYLALDLGLKIRLFKLASELTNINYLKKIPVYTRFGYETGEAMFNKNFENKEEIVNPLGVNFPNRTRQNIVEEGEYNQTISSEALNFTLGFEFQFFNRFWLTPELSYRYELTPSIKKYDWKMDILRASIGLSVDLNKKEKPFESPIIQEEPVEEIVEDKVIEIAKRNNIDRFDFNEIDFTETIVTQTYPILPYIFFDSSSSSLREVYPVNKFNFNEDELENNTIEIYYNLINIIANRMKELPNAKIKLIGNSDGVEKNELNEKLALSLDRVIKIKDIFTSYGISESRISVENRETPKIPTSNRYIEGLQENRRVDIETTNLELLKPVLHSNFLEYKLNKPFSFITKLKTSDDISQVSFSLKDDNNLYHNETFNPTGKLVINHIISEKILGKLASQIDEENDKTIIAEIKVTYTDGEIETKEFEVPVYKEKSSFEVGRLNLIVFDFDKSTISEANKNMIRQFISNSISEKSTTTITGSTDLLGEKDYNKTLSLLRANEVSNYIKSINPNFKISEIKGLGSENILFDNLTPEGRFYCRTVLVEVKTPIEK